MIDEIDRKILQVLGENSRLSVEKVSRAVNLSPTPVWRRIRRLRAEGIIRGYSIDVDMKKCGLGVGVFVFVKLQDRTQATLKEFEECILRLSEVSSCDLVTGPHDYVMTLRVKDMDAYNDFLRSVLSELPSVFSIETKVVIGSVKNTPQLP